MKQFYLFKYFILLLLSCLLNNIVFCQKVIDPSVTDPSYNSKKLATGKSNKSKTAITNKVGDFGCNVANDCFIPVDDSYMQLPRNDDGSYGPIILPFTFDLYGAQYKQVYINTNGNLTFTSSYGGYVAAGFPISIPMVAAFWTDVDTRNTSGGAIYYKVSPTHLIVTWNGVGYFYSHADKLNTFQIIISALGDPLLGGTNNIKFAYKDMQWAVPDGTATYGPATVGANKGDGSHYVQVGRFDEENCDYDGPAGLTDGIGYLENKCFLFNGSTGDINNVPPSVSGLPVNNTITLNVGETASLSPQFIGPEPGQSVSTIIDTTGFCGADYTITNGEVSTVNMNITGSKCNVGTHTITFTATDDGVPKQTTSVNLTVVVNAVNTAPYFDYSVTPEDDAEISVHTGEPVKFTIKAIDEDVGDNIRLSSENIPAGATTNPSIPAGGNPVTTNFSWTPVNADIGTHIITFTATDNKGETTTTSLTINVSSLAACNPLLRTFIRVTPRATIKGESYHTIYKGYGLQQVLLSTIPHGGKGPFTFKWSDGKFGYARIVSPSETTTYGIEIKDSRGCSVTSNITVYVVDARCGNANKKVELCFNGEMICVNKGDVQQMLDQGAILGSCNNNFQINTGTGQQTQPVIQQKTGLFAVYPNPATNVIMLKYNAQVLNKANVIITDAEGRPVINQVFTNAAQTINISKLSTGLYMAKLVIDNKVISTSRFMVNK